jgi:hypothetical protein
LSLPNELLDHAIKIATTITPLSTDDVEMRRAVSATYYALFHQINADAVAVIAPHVSKEVNHRIQRWFDHSEMKKICGRFLKESLDQPLLGLIGQTASSDLQLVCRMFIELQEARHDADYNLNSNLNPQRTIQYVGSAQAAIYAWQRIRQTAEANIFILSLLLWKNWEKERP